MGRQQGQIRLRTVPPLVEKLPTVVGVMITIPQPTATRFSVPTPVTLSATPLTYKPKQCDTAALRRRVVFQLTLNVLTLSADKTKRVDRPSEVASPEEPTVRCRACEV